MIKANIYEKELFIEGSVISDSVKFDTVRFSFPESWKSYEKTVVFSNDAGIQLNILLNSQNPLCVGKDECYIPHEVLKTPGFSVSVFGIKDDSVATTTKKFVKVIESGYALGDEPSEPTLSQYQQIINLTSQAMEIAQSVRDDADRGAFNGDKGEPGQATPEFIEMVERTEENAKKTESARATLENGTEWIFDGGDADTNSADIKFILDNEMSDESENAVENKVIKEYIDNLIKQAKLDAHPIGSYYWSSASTAPSELFGGTWEQVQGKFILAASEKYIAGVIGGEEETILKVENLPKDMGSLEALSWFPEKVTGFVTKTQKFQDRTAPEGTNLGTAEYNFSGDGKAHNNMPPYEVAYCWKRIA